MPPALTQKMMGLPRWAWLAIIVGGGGLGLILRSRQNSETDEADSETEDDYYDVGESPDAGAFDDPTDSGYYYSDPGYTLAGAPNSYGAYGAYNYDQDALVREIGDQITEYLEDALPDAVGTGSSASTQVGCTNANKPRNIPKGYTVECRNDRWHLVKKPGRDTGGGNNGNDHGGGKGDGGKNHGNGNGNGGGKNHGGKNHGGKGDGGKRGGGNHNGRAVPKPVTGGGAPRRRDVHTAKHLPRTGGLAQGGKARKR